MDNSNNFEEKMQEYEKRISVLEAAQQEHQNNAPALSCEEYKSIAASMAKLECDGLITCGDYFEDFIGISFRKFFELQPKVLEVLIGQINTNENQEIKNELQAFIDNLKTVNKLIYDIVENRPFFEILVSFLWELEKARKYYSKNPTLFSK